MPRSVLVSDRHDHWQNRNNSNKMVLPTLVRRLQNVFELMPIPMEMIAYRAVVATKIETYADRQTERQINIAQAKKCVCLLKRYRKEFMKNIFVVSL